MRKIIAQRAKLNAGKAESNPHAGNSPRSPSIGTCGRLR
jgi:hypothetical protein